MRRRKGFWGWLATHKLLAVLLVVSISAVVEIAMLPFDSISQLKTRNPTETALMRQRQEEALDRGARLTIRHQWVPLSTIPEHAIQAILVAEDGAFFAHHGVDWYETWESVKENVRQGRIVRGGSTITQQVAKNLYLSTARTPMRKIKELFLTVALEHQLSKRRILEIYVNSIEWGHGVFGIEAAARQYFHKSARHLTRHEAAKLAVVIPSPLRHRPNGDSLYVRRKTRLLLQRMAARF